MLSKCDCIYSHPGLLVIRNFSFYSDISDGECGPSAPGCLVTHIEAPTLMRTLIR